MKSQNYSKIKQVMRHKAELEAIINETIRKHNEMNKAAGVLIELRPVVMGGVVYLEIMPIVQP